MQDRSYEQFKRDYYAMTGTDTDGGAGLSRVHPKRHSY